MDSEETNNKVLDIVANIVKNQEDKVEQNDEENSTSKTLPHPIRGIPKSGRFWKSKKER